MKKIIFVLVLLLLVGCKFNCSLEVFPDKKIFIIPMDGDSPPVKFPDLKANHLN